MKKKMNTLKILFVFSAFFLWLCQLSAKTPAEVKKEFTGIQRIKINTISGDCFVTRSAGQAVNVTMNHTYGAESGFVPIMEKQGSALVIREKFEGRSSRGSSVWNLSIPDGLSLKFNTASGEFEIEGLKVDVDANSASGDMTIDDIRGELDVNTASGDVKCKNINGDQLEVNTASGRIKLKDIVADFKAGTASGEISAMNITGDARLSTASGDIEIDGCKGKLKASAASGEIEINELILTGECKVSTASGDVEVTLAASPEHDISLSAASGDCLLDFNGNEINATIEVTARASRNRISAPFKFDREELHDRWNDREMVTKTVKVGSGGPYITLESASGKVGIRK